MKMIVCRINGRSLHNGLGQKDKFHDVGELFMKFLIVGLMVAVSSLHNGLQKCDKFSGWW